jgi:crotonobetainyl-CoA:carnitine CoA-transferase CaiB-like acyl-CoA transferase
LGVDERREERPPFPLAMDKPRGREIFKELVKRCDVVTENFSPWVMKNFGLDYPALKELKEDMIMVTSSGFGHIRVPGATTSLTDTAWSR